MYQKMEERREGRVYVYIYVCVCVRSDGRRERKQKWFLTCVYESEKDKSKERISVVKKRYQRGNNVDLEKKLCPTSPPIVRSTLEKRTGMHEKEMVLPWDRLYTMMMMMMTTREKE